MSSLTAAATSFFDIPTPNSIINEEQANTPRPPPTLPHDIHILIILLLAKPELASCCRVSRSFNAIATPHLYQNVAINLSPPQGLQKPISPRYETLVKMAELIVHLTITQHTRELCQAIPALFLPNLITLSLPNAYICHPGPFAGRAAPDTPCPLAASFRPRRLILGWRASSATRLHFYLSSPTHAWPSWVKELIILLPPGTLRNPTSPFSTGRLFLREIPSTVEHLTLVLQPGESERNRNIAYSETTMGRSECSAAKWLADLACFELAMACMGHARVMTVVGLEAAHIPGGAAERVGRAKDTIRGELVKRGWGIDKAGGRAEAVRFVELGEYEGEVDFAEL